MNAIPHVVSAVALPGHRLKLTFDDGVVTEADLSQDLRGPVTEPLKDPAYFARVSVDPESGTVVWPNGFDLDPVVLHGDLPAAEPSALRVTRLETGSARN